MIFWTLAWLVALAVPATQPETMLAVRIHEFGPPEVLRLEQAPKPAIDQGEMLVRVFAASVNPIDWRIRSGQARGLAGAALPYIPGFDVCGVVEQVAPDVAGFKPGDEIYAMIDLRRGGCYAEYVTVREDEAALKPVKATFVEAAAVPLVTLTAWQALFDTARLEKGQTILIHGGAGGVGSMAVQLARWKGARVIATATQQNHDFLRQIGADEVIDYRTQKFEDIVRDADVVLDTVGGDTTDRSLAVLKKGGILVTIAGRPPVQKAEELGLRARSILVHPSPQQLQQIARLVDEGQIRPIVSHVFPLSEAAKAHAQSETRHTRGKIVLQVVADAAATPATQHQQQVSPHQKSRGR